MILLIRIPLLFDMSLLISIIVHLLNIKFCQLFFSYLPLLLKYFVSFVAVFSTNKYWSYIWSILFFIHIPLLILISCKLLPNYLTNDSIHIYSATFWNASYNFLYIWTNHFDFSIPLPFAICCINCPIFVQYSFSFIFRYLFWYLANFCQTI